MRTEKKVRLSTSKPSLRGRKQRTQRQEQILVAGFEEFAAHGYAAARLDDVAKRAGIAKGTIYLYFKDKERLFRAVVRSLIRKRLDVWGGTFCGPAQGLLRELLSRMYTLAVRNERVRAIVRLLVAESGKFPQLSEIYHQEMIGPGLKIVRQMIKKGTESGEFRKSKALEFPQILIAPGLLAIVWTLIFGERHRLDLDAYLKAHLEFVLGSLQKKRT
jgi:AcrR family transcriptional regulator